MILQELFGASTSEVYVSDAVSRCGPLGSTEIADWQLLTMPYPEPSKFVRADGTDSLPPPTSFARRQPPVYDKGKGSNSPWPEGGDVRYDQGAGQGWDLASLRPAQNHENRPSAWPAVQGDIREGEIYLCC